MEIKVEYKKITEGSICLMGAVIHLSKDLTLYDALKNLEDLAIQMDYRTATGASLRNLADYSGVEYDVTDSDACVRNKIFNTVRN